MLRRYAMCIWRECIHIHVVDISSRWSSRKMVRSALDGDIIFHAFRAKQSQICHRYACWWTITDLTFGASMYLYVDDGEWCSAIPATGCSYRRHRNDMTLSTQTMSSMCDDVMPQLPGKTNSSSSMFKVGKSRNISVRVPTKLFPESQRINLMMSRKYGYDGIACNASNIPFNERTSRCFMFSSAYNASPSSLLFEILFIVHHQCQVYQRKRDRSNAQQITSNNSLQFFQVDTATEIVESSRERIVV